MNKIKWSISILFHWWSKTVFWCPSFLLQCYPKSLHTFHQHFFVNSYLHTHINPSIMTHNSHLDPLSVDVKVEIPQPGCRSILHHGFLSRWKPELYVVNKLKTSLKWDLYMQNQKHNDFYFIFSDLHQGLGFRIPHEHSHPFSVLSWVWNCLVLWTVSVKT